MDYVCQVWYIALVTSPCYQDEPSRTSLLWECYLIYHRKNVCGTHSIFIYTFLEGINSSNASNPTVRTWVLRSHLMNLYLLEKYKWKLNVLWAERETNLLNYIKHEEHFLKKNKLVILKVNKYISANSSLDSYMRFHCSFIFSPRYALQKVQNECNQLIWGTFIQ